MARPLRIEFAGALYHITSRGNAREDIFRNDGDRKVLLSVLAKVTEHMHWRCHAYCLMGNHYHLLIETPEPNLARGMRQVNGIYTQRFNWRHARTGHVFQGRYNAILVDRDSYLLELARYIVLNPVRAHLTQSPERWVWSSYRATAGLETVPLWLTVDGVLGQFGGDRARSRKVYAEFVHQGKGLRSVWDGLRQQIYLGGDQFIDCMLHYAASSGDLPEIPRIQKRLVRSLAWYQKQYGNRVTAMTEAYRSGSYTLAAIARHFGMHYSTVSRAVNGRDQARVR